jgi:hypothetical protein
MTTGPQGIRQLVLMCRIHKGRSDRRGIQPEGTVSDAAAGAVVNESNEQRDLRRRDLSERFRVAAERHCTEDRKTKKAATRSHHSVLPNCYVVSNSSG